MPKVLTPAASSTSEHTNTSLPTQIARELVTPPTTLLSPPILFSNMTNLSIPTNQVIAQTKSGPVSPIAERLSRPIKLSKRALGLDSSDSNSEVSPLFNNQAHLKRNGRSGLKDITNAKRPKHKKHRA